MPFTFSHPAIVLPLAFLPRRYVSLTGLIIGSITPDFEYFLRMRVQSEYSHTIGGIFYFNLPFGMLLAFVFHNIIRNNLFDNLPIVLKSRFAIFNQFNWNIHFKKNWLAVMISIVIGAASHIFWDSFTHEHGYFVQRISILVTSIEFFEKKVLVLKVLQHLSTMLGGFIIAYVIYKMPKDRKASPQIHSKYWSIQIIITLAVIALRILSGLDYRLYGHLIATAISAVLLSLILTSMIWQKIKR